MYSSKVSCRYPPERLGADNVRLSPSQQIQAERADKNTTHG